MSNGPMEVISPFVLRAIACDMEEMQSPQAWADRCRAAAQEIEKLRDAINAALTEENPIEGGLWSQEPIGPNETPAEAIKRLIKFRVQMGRQVERDALKAESEKLRAALQWLLNDLEDYPASARPIAAYDNARAALGEKE